ncbi:predicted protein [Brucella abortus bv. 4 str. 292]|uniref:Uncharacterized protein n=9 Tax=Brucella TaxID=234 RepID=C0G6I7_9HYPH|nr:Hypothetical protein, conserved [Brucella ceti str. Cudo]EEP63028.1 Hypothetical protein, conserved [Brucella abortus str. 2308 A]EEX55315.1 predicted protein [Brucella abortus bv. 4 str. 292]EEX59134.1 predicted protein [Brucella abortus bv. 2 str. 86/8/59]EEX61769.1 predicted protein [Brucella abortus bv. 6 str. 870]EEX80449.1 predicted protein [Brucella abortus bv. 9 str. C68]EEX82559.1 predicted protein [Brucella abortus bv. 3 str. Tulya]EEX87501.1 predicted protein [Brucella ceti B1/
MQVWCNLFVLEAYVCRKEKKMMIFLLALSMMVAMAASAIILLLEENASKRQRVRQVAFDRDTLRNMRSR